MKYLNFERWEVLNKIYCFEAINELKSNEANIWNI